MPACIYTCVYTLHGEHKYNCSSSQKKKTFLFTIQLPEKNLNRESQLQINA